MIPVTPEERERLLNLFDNVYKVKAGLFYISEEFYKKKPHISADGIELPYSLKSPNAELFAENLDKYLFQGAKKLKAGTLKNYFLSNKNPRIGPNGLKKMQEIIEAIFDVHEKEIQLNKGAFIARDREQLKFFEDWRKELSNLITAILSRKHVQKNKELEVPQPNNGNKLISAVTDFSWYCYELHSDGNLGRQIIRFKDNDDGGRTAKLRFLSGGQVIEIEGIVRLNSTNDVLIMTLDHPETKSFYTHFMIKFNQAFKEFDLLMGHMMFEHPAKRNVVTKTVLCRKIETSPTPNKDQPPAEFVLEKLVDEVKESDTSKDDIEKEIIKFFARNACNRMSSPRGKIITSIATLQEWIEAYNKKNQNPQSSDKLEKFTGTYRVFYKYYPYEDLDLKEDHLKIELDADTNNLMVLYRHKESEATEQREWQGTGSVNFDTGILTINLSGPVPLVFTKNKRNHEKDKPLCLMISAPKEDQFLDITDISALCGVIVGIRDDKRAVQLGEERQVQRGAVGRLVLILKLADDKKVDEATLNLLKRFFEAYAVRSWIRPPIFDRFRGVEDIKSTIPGGFWYFDRIKDKLCQKKSDSDND